MTGPDRPGALVDDGTDAPRLYWGSGSQVAVRLTAADTRGQVGVTHFVAAAGEAAPLHRHHHEDELFLVARGEVELTVDGATRVVGGGGLAYLPRGSAHRYTVLADRSEFFVATLPGGFERFFATAGLDPALLDTDPAAVWSRERTAEIERSLGTGLEWLTTSLPKEQH